MRISRFVLYRFWKYVVKRISDSDYEPGADALTSLTPEIEKACC
jgi:hypothetical protein